MHVQTLQLYRLLDELRARRPTVEIESCASGGSRVDLGVLEHTDRIWSSDCNDALERQLIQRWTGTPFFPPSGAVRNNHGKATVYASWDGATQVASWRVLAGSSTSSLKTVASANKTGFETTIPLTSAFKVYKVQALDGRHHVLGTSGAFPSNGSQNSGLPQGY